MIFSTPQASSGAASQPKPINLLAMVGAMAAARLRGTRGSGHGLAPNITIRPLALGEHQTALGLAWTELDTPIKQTLYILMQELLP